MMTDDNAKSGNAQPEIADEPGAAERFQRTLRNLLNTSPKPRGKPSPKSKERPASKGRGIKEKGGG